MTRLLSVIMFFTLLFAGCDGNEKLKNAASGDVDSVAYYTNLMMEDSSNFSYWASRSQLYLDDGNIDASLRDLQYALSIAPDKPQLFVILSDVYFALGQVDNGIASLKKAMRLDNKNIVPYLKLSEAYMLLGDSETAIRYAQEAIKIDRRNAESYYVLALAELNNNDSASAILNLKLSASIDTGNYMAYMQLGAIYNSMKDTISKDYFMKALKMVPNDESASYFLGMYYQEHYDFQKALDYFTVVTQVNPENRRAFYNKGYIYLVEMNDPENAKYMFERAVELNSAYVEAVYNLGRTFEAMKQYDSARIVYVRALEILPNYPLAVQGLNRLDDIQIRKAVLN